MKRNVIIVCALLLVGSSVPAQQTIVFPAVVDEVPGRNESLWVTVARFVKVNPEDTVTIRRKWVCLPGGGFVDEPTTAPTITLWGGNDVATRADLLWGSDLLANTDSSAGAVAFEVDGGPILAHSLVHDVSKGVNEPREYSFGQGQLPVAMRTPLSGPSHLQWVGGCLNAPCSSNPPHNWDFLRNNIGLINPNPEPLTVTGNVIPLYTSNGFVEEVYLDEPETFEKTVPPYGWLQFNWVSDRYYGTDFWGVLITPRAGYVISLSPDKENPYYAYASVVFTPDPNSGNQIFNDPMFVPAEPGYVPPIGDVYPQPKGEDE